MRPGATIDHFVIERAAGAGGMGVVYRATDVLAEALQAAGNVDDSRIVITAAAERLLARAAAIHDPERRRSFPERSPEHARTLALYRARPSFTA